MTDNELADKIVDKLSWEELIALSKDIPLASDESSGFDGSYFNFNDLEPTHNEPLVRNLNFSGNDNEFSDFGKKTRQKVGGAVKSVGGKIGGAVKTVGGKIGGAVKTVGDKIGDTKIAQAVKDSKVGGNIVAGLQKVGGGIKKVGSKVGETLGNIKDKAGEVVKKVGGAVAKGVKAIGRGVVVATMSIPRASARTLISFNFRAYATRIAESGGEKNTKLLDAWYKIGGNKDKFMKSVNTGKGKKPLLCGVKCKEKMGKSNFSGDSWSNAIGIYEDARNQMDYSNLEPVVTASLIGTGGTVLAVISKHISQAVGNKQIREQLAQEEDMYNKELEQRADELGVSEQALENEFNLAEQQLQIQSDPINLIQNNPNLTPQEKAEAIKQAQEVLDTKSASKFKKYALYGALGLVVLFIGYKIFKPKKG